jgi:hypothetical protein
LTGASAAVPPRIIEVDHQACEVRLRARRFVGERDGRAEPVPFKDWESPVWPGASAAREGAAEHPAGDVIDRDVRGIDAGVVDQTATHQVGVGAGEALECDVSGSSHVRDHELADRERGATWEGVPPEHAAVGEFLGPFDFGSTRTT